MLPDLDVIVLGTGTSSSIPLVGCLTDPEQGCHCCRSTLDSFNPLHLKNNRRNTSAVVRIKSQIEGERDKVILIDCGKTFLAGAQQHWPAKGLREIDAVILTHAHADAILGLDDLRGWTLRGAIQPSIPIYLTQDTFTEVSKAFPYLTNAGKATGGGDIPALTWQIFDDRTPFEVCGIEVVPLPVHHGKFFTTPPSPYFCLGFLLARQVCYLSDVSYIPEDVWSALGRYIALPSWPPISAAENGAAEKQDAGAKEEEEKSPLKALIIDCLRLEPFTSHFGLGQAMATARRIGAEKNYLIGFGHRTSHALWLSACRALSPPSSSPSPSSKAPRRSLLPSDPSSAVPSFPHQWAAYSGHPDPRLEDEQAWTETALQVVESWALGAAGDEGGRGGKQYAEGEEGEKERDRWEGSVWVRPAVDGMTIRVRKGEGVVDDEYEGEEQ
ncbi:hypothetical protein JCM8097_003217 [Rhodosporidiobolus ruineniae]